MTPSAPGPEAPGPSPAYDPFEPARTPAPQQQPPRQQQPPQQQTPQQQPGPRRNPDGTWTIEVHPPEEAAGAGYPEPRRPLTTPVPIQQPAALPQQQQQPQQPQQQPRRRGRLGLILGISIPIAVLAVAGIVAVILVPGILLDRDAQAAADDYAQQQSEWSAVYSDAALQPLAELDAAALQTAVADVAGQLGAGSIDDASPDPAALQASCDAVAATQGQASMLTAAAPALRVVEGGERNAAYAAAVAQDAAMQARYAAASTLAADVGPSFDAIAGACALLLAHAEVDAAFLPAFAAYEATLTLPQGGSERFDISASEYLTFTCFDANGCTSYVDRAARAATADAWDASFVAYYAGWSQSYVDHCPTADLQAVCDAWSSAADDTGALASGVSAALRAEDVTGGAAAGDPVAAPDYVAAADAFIAGDDANADAAGAVTEQVTGVSSMAQALVDLVDDEAQQVRDLTTAVRG